MRKRATNDFRPFRAENRFGSDLVSCFRSSLQFVAPKMPQGEARGGRILKCGRRATKPWGVLVEWSWNSWEFAAGPADGDSESLLLDWPGR